MVSGHQLEEAKYSGTAGWMVRLVQEGNAPSTKMKNVQKVFPFINSG